LSNNENSTGADASDSNANAPADDAGQTDATNAGAQLRHESTDEAGGEPTDTQSADTANVAQAGDDAQGASEAGPAILPEHVEIIAQVCNDANAAYSASIGDFTYGPWADTPEAIRQSIRDGVRKHLENPGLTPEQSHEAWLKFKAEQGYTYGPVRDDEAKVHPCMVPYTDLPQAQRSKDFIFRGIVRSMAQSLGLA
jgi:hypothetical protein